MLLDVEVVIENEEFLRDMTIHSYITKINNEPINIHQRQCIACDEDIDPRRLAAMPSTKYCIDCATSREQQERFNHMLNTTRGIIHNISL